MVFSMLLLVSAGIFTIISAWVYAKKGHDVGPSYIIGTTLIAFGAIMLMLYYAIGKFAALRFFAFVFGIIFLSISINLFYNAVKHKSKLNSSPFILMFMALVSVCAAFGFWG